MDTKLKDYLVHFVVFFILALLIPNAHFMLWVLLSFVWFILDHFLHKLYISDKIPKEIIDNISIIFTNDGVFHRDCLEVLIIIAINLAGAYTAKIFI